MPQKGRFIDTNPLQPWEWEALRPHLAYHWRLYFTTLWETGIRAGEALDTKRDDVRRTPAGWYLDVTRKKKRGREVVDSIPISEDLARQLIEYRRPRHRRDSRVFPFSLRAAAKALSRAAAAAGLRPTVHPHLFRHGFARRVARTPGVGETPMDHRAMLAKMLGHSGLRNVDRYYMPGPSEVQDAWARFRGPTPAPEPAWHDVARKALGIDRLGRC